MNRFLFFILSLIVFHRSYSQDIHFSQFFASPLTLNPALTGDFKEDWRLSNNYRNQWKSVTKPFNTIGIGYDQRFFINNEKIGAGLVWINDRSGVLDLTVNKIYFSGAYHKITGKHSLSVGVQLGWVSKAFGNNMTFPDQFNINTGYYDSGLPTSETDMSNSMSYFDMNAGVKWSTKYKKWTPEAGLAFFHINRPDESFTSISNKLPVRTVFTAGARYALKKYICIFPQLQYMASSGARDFVIGSLAEFSLLSVAKMNLTGFYGGAFFRTDVFNQVDAGIITAGLNFKRMNFGISYDINISRLNVASNYKGALEFSLIYMGLNTRLEKLKIPCERY